MAKETKIEWADSTASLWIGCTKLTPGCDNCYAEADWDRRKHRVTWGPHGARSFCQAGWNLILSMQRRAAGNGGVDPALGRKRRIFVNSLSDFFDNHRSIVWREEAFKLFEACRDVILILVTKRPENVIRMVPEGWLYPGGWPPHVWLLVSAEDQERYDHRWPLLQAVPGVTVRGLSCEPLLGPIVLRDVLWLDWVIVGGESGPGARPMHPDWARSLRDQCAAADVAFHFKQWGEWTGVASEDLPTTWGRECDRFKIVCSNGFNGALDLSSVFLHKPSNWPGCFPHGQDADCSCTVVNMKRLGKAAAGRELDGRTWDEVPA